MPLTSEAAQRMISTSQEKARELGIHISTAIVDAGSALCLWEDERSILVVGRRVAGEGVYRCSATERRP
jgi:uncharacterized protein GlcG (DUF336 family)